MRRAALVLAAFLAGPALAAPALAAEGETELKHVEWSFDGPFGTFDRAQLQRGFQVYKEVCAACHGMKYMSYRNLGEPGGPEFPEAQVKAIAASYMVPSLDENGEPSERPALPSDRFKSPFPNEVAARAANNGASPPDLSLMAKARHGGPDYIYSILTGYEEAPADVTLNAGMSYNKYFSGHQIGMPQPIVVDDQVTYSDGTKATIDQMARDVSAFLQWTAEPHQEARKSLGVKVIIFLLVLCVLFYFSYKRVWSDVEH